jgi:cell division ATPase FtsA
MEAIAFAGVFLFMGAVLIRLFIRTSNKNRAIILLSAFALTTAASMGTFGVLTVAAIAVISHLAYQYAIRSKEAKRLKRDAEYRRAGAIFGEEFFRKEEENRMRQKMRDTDVPKKIGQEDSKEIKEARASLMKRIK